MHRVLIIEDNPIEAREISLFLGQAGFELEVAGSAELGYERVNAKPFDLILIGGFAVDLFIDRGGQNAFARGLKPAANIGLAVQPPRLGFEREQAELNELV